MSASIAAEHEAGGVGAGQLFVSQSGRDAREVERLLLSCRSVPLIGFQ